MDAVQLMNMELSRDNCNLIPPRFFNKYTPTVSQKSSGRTFERRMKIFKFLLFFIAVFLTESANVTDCNIQLQSQFAYSTFCGDAVITNSSFVCDNVVTFALQSSTVRVPQR